MTVASDFPFVVNKIVRDQLYQLTVHRCCVARWISSQKDKGDGGCSSRTSLSHLPRSWESGEVHAEWQPVSVTPVYKAMKDDPGNYRPLSLTSVPEKVLGKILLGAVERHLKDDAIIRHSQHRFTKRESCLINVLSFYDDVTHLGDEGKAINVVFLDFSEAHCPSQHPSEQVFRLRDDQIRGVLRGSVLGEVLFNIFVGNMDSGIEGTLSKFPTNTKLCGAVDTLERRDDTQRESLGMHCS